MTSACLPCERLELFLPLSTLTFSGVNERPNQAGKGGDDRDDALGAVTSVNQPDTTEDRPAGERKGQPLSAQFSLGFVTTTRDSISLRWADCCSAICTMRSAQPGKIFS